MAATAATCHRNGVLGKQGESTLARCHSAQSTGRTWRWVQLTNDTFCDGSCDCTREGDVQSPRRRVVHEIVRLVAVRVFNVESEDFM